MKKPMHALAIPSHSPPRLRRRAWTLYDGSIRGTYGAGRSGADRRKMAFQSKQSMTDSHDRTEASQGIEGALLANRARIVRFHHVPRAGHKAEGLFHDLRSEE